VKFVPLIFPRLLVYADIISRPMTSLLAHSEYVNFLPDWVRLFDKVKRAFTYALLPMWMYSI